MLTAFLDTVRDGDMIAPRRMADRLHLPMTGLARLARLNRNTLSSKASSSTVQTRLGEIASIIARAAELSGDEGRAIIWFRHQPITGFSGKTARELVEDGHGDAVLNLLDDLENGVHA